VTPAPRNHWITRGRVIAWLVSLALGVGWLVFLTSLPSGFDPVVALVIELGGIFGFVFGLLVATGMLVKSLSVFGARPGSMSRPSGELAPDVVFGVCVMLFALPSLWYAHFGG
jgi:hypothetical protein